MKKITSFLMLMLMLLVCNNAQADVWVVDEEADGLIEDASQITSPYTESSEGSIEGMIDGDASTFWHSAWSGGSVAAGLHYFQVENIDLPEYFGFMYTRRAVANDQITKWSVYGVPADKLDASKAECTLLAEVETPYGSNNETLYSQAIESKGFTTVRFYEEQTTTDRGYFHIAEFQILPCKQIEDRDAALANLQTVYAAYSTYSGTFTAGTEPGTYPQELVEAFEKALSDAEVADTPEGDALTADQLNAMAQAIKDTYDALVAGKIGLPVYPTGYYYIHPALDYYETVTTEEHVDPESGETVPGETVTYHINKAMYDNGGTAAWKTQNDSINDATFLWYMAYDEDTKAYQIKNVAYDRYFGSCTQSSNVTLDATLDPVASEITLETIDKNAVDYTLCDGAKAEGVNVVSIHHPNENNTYQYFHQGGHASGAGKSGNVVGWTIGAGGSNWYFEAVDEATAQALITAYEPIKNYDVMCEKVNEMIADGNDKLKVAIDTQTKLDETKPLITSATQFYSPYTTEDQQTIPEDAVNGVYDLLLDGSTTTYWHSAWENGSLSPGSHYIVVNIEEGLTSGFAFKMTRRSSGTNDHPVKFDVFGATSADYSFADDTDGGFGTWTKLASVETPYGSNTETVTSDAITFDGTYNYFKFLCTETNPIAYNRGYWHMSEFQMYPAEVIKNETSQYVALGSIATNLEAAIAAKPDSITTDYYNTLKAAYDAFIAKFVDNSELRAMIETTQGIVDRETIGTDPGYYEKTVTSDVLTAAVAYDKAGKYTQDETDNYADKLTDAANEIASACIQPKADKWYSIKFDSEANYEAHGWAKTNAENTTLGNLFDCVAVPANIAEDDATQLEIPENIYSGQNVRFLNENDVDDEDAMAFRFIVYDDEDGAEYVIQHKSGLYLQANGTLGLNPAMVGLTPIGYGKNLIQLMGISDADDADPVFAHAQNAGHLMVSWGSTEVSSNSALYIHEIDATGDAEAAKMAVNPNGMKIMAYPISIAVSAGQLYQLEGQKAGSLCFSKIDKTVAGRAALYVNGDYTQEADEDEGTDEITLTTDASVIGDTIPFNGMHGSYAYAWPSDEGKTQVVVRAHDFFATRMGYALVTMASTDTETGSHVYDKNGNEGRDIMAYTGWIEMTEVPEVSGTYDLEIEVGGDLTKVNTVIADLQQVGKIYTIDGKFLGNGNLNTVKNMGRGIYVVNGVKVAVNK